MTKKNNNDKAKKESNIILYPDHPLPRTRREFLAHGLIGATGFLFGPSLTNMMKLSPSEVLAADVCIHEKICANIPFICFDAAGGMNWAGGNVIVGFGSGEDQMDFGSAATMSDYIKLGLPSTMHPSLSGMVDDTYGIKLHSTSGFLEGLNSVLAPTEEDPTDLRKSVDGVFVCAITSDDTKSNPINTSHMARKAGALGDLVQLIGTSNTDSGGNSIGPEGQVDLLYRPSPVSRFTDGESLISIGDAMMGSGYLNASDADFGAARLKAFMSKVKNIGVSRFEKTAMLQKEIEAKAKVNSALTGTKDVFDKFSPVDLNPLKNASDKEVVQAVFGSVDGNGNYSISTAEERVATVANLITKRVAGAGTISIGGYDYHNGSAATGNTRDYNLGRYVGQTIKLASIRGENLFMHLFTDGGVVGDAGGALDETVSGKGRVNWTSDSGTRSGTLMLVYKHGHERTDGEETSDMLLDGKKRQVGFYNQAGGVNPEANSMSNSSGQLWMSVILNYLSVMCNTTDEEEVYSVIEEAFEDNFGDLPSDWKDLIRFKPLAA